MAKIMPMLHQVENCHGTDLFNLSQKMMSLSFDSKKMEPPLDGLVMMPRPTSATLAHPTGAWHYGCICPHTPPADAAMDKLS
jgi:hypothetical protein